MRTWAGRSGRPEAGTTSAGSATAPSALGPAMSERTRKRSGRIKDRLPGRVRELEDAHPDAEVEVWALDEHRIGLQPILRVVWAPRGKRPRAVVRPRYEWLYVVAFVCPERGTTSFWLVPAVSVDVFQAVLDRFAGEQGAGKRKHILLVLDRAGWHVSGDVEAPEGITLDFLPPHSPELQPAERLWTLIDEPAANRAYASVAELEAILGPRCVELTEMPELVRSHTLFHWWPRTRTAHDA